MARRRLLSDIWVEYNGVKASAATTPEFDEHGESAVVNLECSGRWKVSSKPDWITVDKSTGEGGYTTGITITAAAAPTTADRSGDVVFMSVSTLLSVVVHVSQEGIQDYVHINDKTAFVATMAWYASSSSAMTDSVHGWNQANVSTGLSLDPTTADAGNVKLNFSWTANSDTANTRTLTAEIRSKIYDTSGLYASITLTQDRKTYIDIVSVTPSSFDFNGGSGTIKVKSNTTGWTLTSSSTGLTFNSATAYTYTGTVIDADIEIPFTVVKNTSITSVASYTLTATAADYATTHDSLAIDTANVTVGLYPYIIFENKPTANFTCAAQSFNVALKANCQWTASSDMGWASLANDNGTGDLSPFTVSLLENTSITTNRTATIKAVANALSSVYDSFTITQLHTDPYVDFSGSNPEGGSITITPRKDSEGNPTGDYDIAIHITYKAQTVSLNVLSNDSWTVSKTGDFTINPTAGTGDQAMTMTFTENTGSDAKSYSATATTTHTKNDGDYAKAYITISQDGSLWVRPSETAIAAPATGETHSVTFDTTGAFNQSTDFASWVTPSAKSGVSGSTINYGIAANTSIVPRSTSATFALTSYPSITETITINQAGLDTIFSISPTSYTAATTGETFVINVTANCNWTATSSLSLSLAGNNSRGNGTINVTVPAWTEVGIDSRTFVVTVSTNDSYATSKSLTCTIYQYKVTPYITIVEDSLSFDQTGGTKSFTVSSNAAWTISTGYDTAMVTNLSPSNGAAGTTSVSTSVSNNTSTSSRSTTVTAYLTDFTTYKDSISIEQGALSPSLSANALYLEAPAGSTDSTTINANGKYTVTSYPDWVTITGDVTGGTDGVASTGTITATAKSANTGASPRTGYTVVKLDTYGTTLNILTTQAGSNFLVLSADTKTMGAAGGTITLTTSASTSGSLTYKMNGGSAVSVGSFSSGDASFPVSIPANTTFSSRTYVFTATSTDGTMTDTWTLTQDADVPYIYFDGTTALTKTVGYAAGSFTAALTTNDPNWSITYTGDLIASVSPTTGTGNATVTVTYNTNFTSSKRSATVTATSNNGKTAKITITQDATSWSPYLNLAWANSSVGCSTTSNTLYYTANTSFSLAVTSGGGTLASTTKSISKSLSTTTGSINYTFGANTSASATIIHIVTGSTTDGGTATASTSFTQAAYTPSINVSPESASFGKEGGSTSVTISSSDAWEYSTGCPSWVTLSKTTGSAGNTTITATVNSQSSTSSRSARIYFKLSSYPTYTDYIDISQDAGTTSTQTVAVTLKFNQDDEGAWYYTWNSARAIPSEHPEHFEIDTFASGYDLTGTSESNVATNMKNTAGVKISVTVTEATWDEGWSSGVYVTYTTSTSVSINTASSHYLSISGPISDLAYNTTSFTVTASSNTSYSICIDGAQIKSGSAGQSTFTFTISQNYSSGLLTAARTFSVSGQTTDSAATDSITVTQDGYDDRITPSITLTPSSTSISNDATSFTLSVSTTPTYAPWSLSYASNSNISSVSQTTGVGAETITVNVGAYPTAAQTYSFTAATTYASTDAKSNASATATVTQAAPTYSIDLGSDQTIGAAGGTLTVPVTVIIPTSNWTLSTDSSSSSWITIGTTAGAGNTNVTITVASNSSTSDRTATLTGTNTNGSVTDTMTITQDGVAPVVKNITISSVSADSSNLYVKYASTGISNVTIEVTSDMSGITSYTTTGSPNPSSYISIAHSMDLAENYSWDYYATIKCYDTSDSTVYTTKTLYIYSGIKLTGERILTPIS